MTTVYGIELADPEAIANGTRTITAVCRVCREATDSIPADWHTAHLMRTGQAKPGEELCDECHRKENRRVAARIRRRRKAGRCICLGCTHPERYGPGCMTAPEPAPEPEDEDEDTCQTDGCGASLDDGEGYDGYCGNCADRLEQAGYWS